MLVKMRAFLLLIIGFSSARAAFDDNTTSASGAVASDKCILPPYPDHGTYVVLGNATASPGQAVQVTALKYACEPGYLLSTSENVALCYEGVWYKRTPQCRPACRLTRHPSVQYLCPGDEEQAAGHRECADEEPVGTVVRPRCTAPSYSSPAPLPLMRCEEGGWDNHPTCIAQCGILTPRVTPLILNGSYSDPLEDHLPWHAMIYRTTQSPYVLLCGGSLVTTSVIISAAHCFWRDVEKLLPGSQFSVAVGKIYRQWDSPKDYAAQKSEIKEIIIPRRFMGAAANFQDDIALLVVSSPFQLTASVRPVCLDFDRGFEHRQLQNGNFGKLPRWTFKGDNKDIPALEVVDMTYLDIDKCLVQSPPDFRDYITSDKICSSVVHDNTTVRQGYSGSGLVFPEPQRGVQRHYLRGVASTAPSSDSFVYPVITFTQILKHEHFIKQYVQ